MNTIENQFDRAGHLSWPGPYTRFNVLHRPFQPFFQVCILAAVLACLSVFSSCATQAHTQAETATAAGGKAGTAVEAGPGAPESASGGPETSPPTESAAPSVWQSDPASGDLVYTPLSIRFPEHVSDLLRVGITNLDDQGTSIAVGYNGTEFNIAVTLYVVLRSMYERRDLEGHFIDRIATIRYVHPDCEVVSADWIRFPAGKQELEGLGAFVRFSESGREWGSYLIVLPYGERFIVLRASFPGGDTDNTVWGAWRILTDFMTGIEFPPDVH